jgi:hypothetical protein
MGDEIAGHTIHHPNLAENPAQAAGEIRGIYEMLEAEGIPRNKLAGFRHPFLSLSKTTYDALFVEAGAAYDSSITLNPLTQGYWPFTLDNGMPFSPQPCFIECAELQAARYPGKWVMPIYQILDADTNLLYTTMDPILNAPADYVRVCVALRLLYLTSSLKALANLKHSFRLHRRTKLPFGLHQHSTSYIANTPANNAARIKLLQDFIEWTLATYEDVWV